MKKLLFVILSLFALSVRADNTITSKEYVDGQVSDLQTQIPAKNTNTVVMNTGTAGTIGEKAIYDTTAAYGTQTDALVTAGAFNTAIQNALESEFVCIEWQGSVHDNAHCLLYEVRGATPATTNKIANGYTQLEYITTDNSSFIRLPGFATGETSFDMTTTKLCTEPYKGLYGAASPASWIEGTGIETHNGNAVFLVYGGETRKDTAMRNDTETRITQNKNIYIFTDINGTRTYTRPESTFQTGYQITIGAISAWYSTRPCASIWKYFYVSNMVDSAGTPLPNMRLFPARRDSDGELGMYDLVSNTFFTNSGTGEFIAGPAISSNLYLPSGN